MDADDLKPAVCPAKDSANTQLVARHHVLLPIGLSLPDTQTLIAQNIGAVSATSSADRKAMPLRLLSD